MVPRLGKNLLPRAFFRRNHNSGCYPLFIEIPKLVLHLCEFFKSSPWIFISFKQNDRDRYGYWLIIGLWFMKKWKNCQSLKQLTMADSKEIEATFLYKLAEKQVNFMLYNFF